VDLHCAVEGGVSAQDLGRFVECFISAVVKAKKPPNGEVWWLIKPF